MIPKIFHHVWVGSNPMPEKEIKYIESFRRHHPDWEFMFWIEDNISTLQMPQNCQEAYNKTLRWDKSTPCYACQADVIRQVAVLKYGGIYVDTDVECFKSIENLIESETDFIGIKPRKVNWITNAFFGASKGFKLIENIVKDLKPRPPAHNGPTFLTNHLYKFLLKPHRGVNSRAKVESLSGKNIKILSNEIWSHENKDAYMKHYFKASWKKCE